MKILISTGHPAQIHNFRLFRENLIRDGHEVIWLSTNKDISLQLLEIYGIPFTLLKRPGKSAVKRLCAIIGNTWTVIKTLRRNKIDLVVSRGDPYTSIGAFFCRTPHITLNDTENAAKVGRFFSKFVSDVFVPSCFHEQLRKDQQTFNANIELFYLHRNRYAPSSPSNLLGLVDGEKYALIRFVRWDAYHDVDLSGGFTAEKKRELVETMTKYARVFISSEDILPDDLEQYRIRIPLERMHDVLFGASLVIGESATMASESVVLGTPAIYVDEVGRGYTDEEAEAGLLFMFKPDEQDAAIRKAEEVLSGSMSMESYKARSAAFLESKIDPTAWLTWYVENYPSSEKEMKTSDDAQKRFR